MSAIDKFNKDMHITETGNNEVVSEFHRWASQITETSCLLIFDNAVNEDVMMQFLPFNFIGDILITSLNSNWRHRFIPLNLLDTKDSIDLILNSTNSVDIDSAVELSQELGNLPLALEQASAYIRETSISIEVFIDRFKKYRRKITEIGKPLNYDKNLSTTWAMSISVLKEELPECINFFYALCFLAPELIDRKWFEGQLLSPYSVNKYDAFSVDKYISKLKSFSLIQTKDEYVSLHRLVSVITLDQMEESLRNDWIDYISVFMVYILKVENMNVNYYLTYHLSHISKLIVKNNRFNDSIFSLLIWYSEVLYHFSEINNSELLVNYLDEKASECFVVSDPRISGISHMRAGLYKHKGAYNLAKIEWERAYDVSTEPQNKLAYLISLLNNELEIGNTSAAVDYFELICTYDLSHIDFNDIVFLKMSESRIRIAQSEFNIAESLLLEVLEFYNINKINIKNSSRVLPVIEEGLGNIYQRKGQYKLSTEYYLKSIKHHEILLNRKVHSEIAASLSNIGLNYYNGGETDKAKRYFRKALRMFEEVFSEPDSNKAHAYNYLGMIEDDYGNLEKALEYFYKSLDYFKINHDNENHKTATIYHNLGGVYQKLKKYDEAESYINLAIKEDRAVFSDNHPEVAKDIGKLGALKLEMLLYNEAKSLFEEALRIYKYNSLEKHIDYAMSLGHYGITIFALNEENVGKKYVEQALSIISINYPDSLFHIQAILGALEQTLFKTNKILDQAEYFLNLSNEYF
ncbi:tetratricopeptide repeat protein [Paenibacillus xylanexedens]|uniref:tetratricopeptide repeat protein n=1 Tax=Paenibacillus xylanexedens TaxID=528191 RepID=UPI001643CE5D|nr:tetratricopeptide repeat protein [Paenibacillus xylanexedens]